MDENIFGERLRSYRLAHDMSQEQLATKLGTSKQVISRYESGQRTPKISVLAEYAKRLDLDIHYFLRTPFEIPPSTYTSIVSNLSEARLAASLTQESVAEYFHLSSETVSNWERGYSRIESTFLLKMLLLYKVDVYEFLESCGILSMDRVDGSDYDLSPDAREVADAYTLAENLEIKNAVRRLLKLNDLEGNADKSSVTQNVDLPVKSENAG